MDKILVSIIIPFYNTRDFLEAALDSVQEQDLKDIEVILIDDGSTDDSAELAKRFCIKDARFTLIQQANQGVAQARNRGLQKARGTYLYFMDADDLLMRHGLKYMVAEAQRYGLSMVVGETNLFYGSNITSLTDVPEKCYTMEIMSSSKFVQRHQKKCVVWAYLYRKDFFEQQVVSFLNVRYFEDCELTPRAVLSVECIGYVAQPFHGYRKRFGSITTGKRNERFSEDALRAAKSLVAFFDGKILSEPQNRYLATWIAELFLLALGNARRRNSTSYHDVRMARDRLLPFLMVSIHKKHKMIHQVARDHWQLLHVLFQIRYAWGQIYDNMVIFIRREEKVYR